MSTDGQHRPGLLGIIGLAAAVACIAFIALISFLGWGIVTGRVSETKVLAGNKLPPRLVKVVSASAGLNPGERIIYFYSAAIMPAGDGNLLTDQRVISYVDDGTDAWCDWIAIEDIIAVNFDKSESWLDDSTIVVTSSDGSEITLYASSEGGGDVRFVDAIRKAAKLDGKVGIGGNEPP
ncbi:MAG: hypothetical protein AAF085_16635 [Planctomycetota bacterium]